MILTRLVTASAPNTLQILGTFLEVDMLSSSRTLEMTSNYVGRSVVSGQFSIQYRVFGMAAKFPTFVLCSNFNISLFRLFMQSTIHVFFL